ncbi:phage major capsid protein, partial [Bacillus subtilis]|nr:phage major capsid protein [Bacillus subtilis]
DMVALRVTQQVGFMTLAEDAFAALTPAAEGTGA